jgi:hypothetical protein
MIYHWIQSGSFYRPCLVIQTNVLEHHLQHLLVEQETLGYFKCCVAVFAASED